jgi:hypothetical protein
MRSERLKTIDQSSIDLALSTICFSFHNSSILNAFIIPLFKLVRRVKMAEKETADINVDNEVEAAKAHRMKPAAGKAAPEYIGE